MKATNYLLLLWMIATPCFLLSQDIGALKVTLAVQDGKLVVHSSEFESNNIVFPPTAQTEMVSFLNRSFAELDSLFENHATSWPFQDMATQPLDEVFREGYTFLTSQDGVGRAVSDAFNEQVMSAGSDLSLKDFIDLYLFGPLSSNLWINSPLRACSGILK